MLRRKPTTKTKKPVKRVIKKRNKNILSMLLFTAVLSGLAVLLAFLFMKRPFVISPIAVQTLAAEDSDSSVLTQELAKLSIHAVQVRTEKDSITIRLSSTEEVILSPTRDIHSQLASLQLIMARLTMEGKHFSRLDLRFDKPVIVFGS